MWACGPLVVCRWATLGFGEFGDGFGFQVAKSMQSVRAKGAFVDSRGLDRVLSIFPKLNPKP